MYLFFATSIHLAMPSCSIHTAIELDLYRTSIARVLRFLQGYLTFCGRLHSHRIRNFSSTIDPTAKYNVTLFKFIMCNFPIFLPMIGRCYGNTAVVACIPLVLSFFSSQRNVKCNCMWDRSFCHKLFLLDFE